MSQYRLDECLGKGGMAEVYRGALLGVEGFSRPVALKRVLPSFSSDAQFAKLFINEAQIASWLQHPNIVSVIDFSRDDEGHLFLAMELVEGINLVQLMAEQSIEPSIAALIVGEILRGLDFAHNVKRDNKKICVAHRDISPHNILLSWNGAIKISDFGIAKAIGHGVQENTGTLRGKLTYMSPEQARGHGIDGRADLFSVGVIFYEMLTGQRIYKGQTDSEKLNRLLYEPHIPLYDNAIALPPDVGWICKKLMEKSADDRFLDARSALNALYNSGLITPQTTQRFAALMSDFHKDNTTNVTEPKMDPIVVTAKYDIHQLMNMPTQTAGDILQNQLSKPATIKNQYNDYQYSSDFPKSSRKNMWFLASGVVVVLGMLSLFFLDRQDSEPNHITQASLDTVDTIETQQDTAKHNKTQPVMIPNEQVVINDIKRNETKPTTLKQKTENNPVKKQITYGWLSVHVSPGWAIIQINGKKVGETPLLRHQLKTGHHKLSLYNDETGKQYHTSLWIKRGKQTQIKHQW